MYQLCRVAKVDASVGATDVGDVALCPPNRWELVGAAPGQPARGTNMPSVSMTVRTMKRSLRSHARRKQMARDLRQKGPAGSPLARMLQ
jgi:hypothetical protein